jgi:hypothetical protein
MTDPVVHDKAWMETLPPAQRLFMNTEQLFGRVVRQFLFDYADEFPEVRRVVEVGPWPVNAKENRENDVALSEVLEDASNSGLAVDIQEKPPYILFSEELYLRGDYTREETRIRLDERLGGAPHLIMGNLVFDRDTGADLYARTGTFQGFGPALGFKLTIAAAAHLAPGGYLAVGTDSHLLIDREPDVRYVTQFEDFDFFL